MCAGDKAGQAFYIKHNRRNQGRRNQEEEENLGNDGNLIGILFFSFFSLKGGKFGASPSGIDLILDV